MFILLLLNYFVYDFVYRKGSVVVEFSLQHMMYLDSPSAALDLSKMKAILVDHLKHGHLGIFKASLENFSFVSTEAGMHLSMLINI